MLDHADLGTTANGCVLFRGQGTPQNGTRFSSELPFKAPNRGYPQTRMHLNRAPQLVARTPQIVTWRNAPLALGRKRGRPACVHLLMPSLGYAAKRSKFAAVALANSRTHCFNMDRPATARGCPCGLWAMGIRKSRDRSLLVVPYFRQRFNTYGLILEHARPPAVAVCQHQCED